MSFAGGTQDVLQRVNQFWSMLDDLSENDPAAYSKFIQKQMGERAEFIAPPELDSCVYTEILEPKKGLLYVNICSWKRVPAPQDPSKPLPVCAGELETDANESQGLYTVLDVALNPVVLDENKQDKTEVYMLALSFAQQQHGLSSSPTPPNTPTQLVKPQLTSCSRSPPYIQKQGSRRQPVIRPSGLWKQFDPVASTSTCSLRNQSTNSGESVAGSRGVELTVELPKASKVCNRSMRLDTPCSRVSGCDAGIVARKKAVPQTRSASLTSSALPVTNS
ncbi:PIH1 domain-containing protein 2 [Lates japonicus]|uniref:PIH1 domain-containing protein 2 n=1 Tax=Lates japonicus TaxID=270547 RepID=A0AAD3MEU7_LATJO|nr:PIH1 domain-containing protein 2 [Lates japonicus]